MHMTDWATVEKQAVDAAATVLTGAWDRVSKTAVTQIEAMTKIAARMEADYAEQPPALSESEYQSVRSAQKNALEGILSAYEGIGILAAEQAADAAWAVLEKALVASIPFA